MADSNADNTTASTFQDKIGSMPAFLKGLDCLKDPKKPYQEKVNLLLQAWEGLATYKKPTAVDANDGFTLDDITERLYRDTLRLILHGDWDHLPQIHKTHLSTTLLKTANNLTKPSAAYQLCQHVIQLVKTPWEIATLKKIVNGEEIDEREAMAFCLEEKPTLLNLRLDTLCESNCLDMALKLVKVCRKCLTNSDPRFLEACSDEVKEHWLDMHVALIYRYDQAEFIQLLKQLADDVACQVVKRFIERGLQSQATTGGVRKRLWRKSLNIAELASKSLLTHALGVWPPSTIVIQFMAIQLFHLQKSLGKKSEHLVGMLQTMMDGNNFLTSKHMYLLCHALSVEKELKSFCIELYARAVAVDLNHLEKWKQSASTNSADAERVKTTEVDLAKEFSFLTELVESNTRVARECALTAFSLAPTPERYAKLEALQAQFAAEQVVVKTEPQLPVSPIALVPLDSSSPQSVSLVTTHERTDSSVVGEPPPGSGGGPGGGGTSQRLSVTGSCSGINNNNDPLDRLKLSFSNLKETIEDVDSGVDLNDVTIEREIGDTQPYSEAAAESLGIPNSVIKDLSVVVHSCRWEVLTWKNGWSSLSTLCQEYLADPEKKRSVTKDLKFLNSKLDYSQFDHLPKPEVDLFTGIEKGYENYVDDVDIDSFAPIAGPSSKRKKTSQVSKKKKRASRPTSESSGPEDVLDRKKMTKKKLNRKALPLKLSSDSDNAKMEPVASSVDDETLKRSARLKASKKLLQRTSPLVEALRSIRPFSGDCNQWSETSLCEESSNGNNHVQLQQQKSATFSRCSSSASSPSSTPSPVPPLASTSGSPTLDHSHFAPMLSTLNMYPKVVLTRTPVKSPGPSPVKRITAKSSSKKDKKTSPGSTSVARVCSQLLLDGGKHNNPLINDKLNSLLFTGDENRLAQYKTTEHLMVMPSTQTINMVQLPSNQINNNMVATANGLPMNSGGSTSVSSSSSNNNGHSVSGEARRTHEQQQPQQQDEAGKASSSSTSSSEEMPIAFPNAAGLEITSTSAGNGGGSGSVSSSISTSSSSVLRNDTDNIVPTFVSTPSVSIFQVANRPTGNNSSGAVLQPVAAVMGFNGPTPRTKAPSSSSGNRRAHRAAPTRPIVPTANNTTTDNNAMLSQLLVQSPNVSSIDTISSVSHSNNMTFNGPSQKPTTPAKATTSQTTGKGRASKRGATTAASVAANARALDTVTASILATSSIPAPAMDVSVVLSPASVTCRPGGPSADGSPICHVPLVKYVDLNSVSSPTRPRPGSTTGMRRPSAGSNSNSPDPHRSTKSRASISSSQNPTSPAFVNSPQSPALQAPPSPHSFRKQPHSHVYSGVMKPGGGDRLAASPSHPSQCSSPFSRPSSRSQDTSPSPSDILGGGSMFPPGYHQQFATTGAEPIGPGNATTVMITTSTHRFNAAASPSHSGFASSASLPKFGHAFGKRGAHMTEFNTPSPIPVNSLQDPQLQQVNRPLGITALPPAGGNGFGNAGRRFVEQPPVVIEEQNPVAEEEGLGSRLSLLESALNGQISRSPTRGMAQQQQQHLIGSGNADLLLSDSAHSISPLVSGMDSQSGGSDVGASGGSNLLNEQLREFESVFMRVASSTTRCRNNSQTTRSSEWDAADLEPESSYMAIEAVGPGEFLAQHSTFSDSMDVSEADPSPPSPGCSEDPLSHSEASERLNSTTLGSTDAPLEQLLNAAAIHRHALVRDEKDSGIQDASLSSVVVKQEPMDESSSTPPEASDDQDQQLHHLLPLDENQLDLLSPSSLTASHSFNSLELTVATTSTTNTTVTIKTELHSSSKCVAANRNKNSAKCSPVVSPGPSGSNTPNKNTTQGTTPAPATSSAPTTPLSAAAAAAAAAAKAPQKAHDDEGTVSRVHAILEMYKEQLRNSPDLQNKPAPRRRSNPLPSPTTTPKRRKSVQNKTKLMSQHLLTTGGSSLTEGASVSGADLTLTTSSSAESTTSVLGDQLAATSVLPDSITTLLPARDDEPVVKMEPVTTVSSITASIVVTSAPSTPTTSATTVTLSTVEKTEESPPPAPAPSPAPVIAPPTAQAPASVQVLSAPAGIQLTTIPVSTVVTSRPVDDPPATTAPPPNPTAATTITSLTGMTSTGVINMQQLLVSQPGGRGNAQLLIAGAGGAPYLVNLSTRQGTPTRFLQVRTANGQQSLINIGSARLNTTTSIRATPSSTTAAQPPPAVSIQQVEQLTPSIIASAKPVTAPPVLAPEISAILQQAVGTTVVVGKEQTQADPTPMPTSTLTICSSQPNSPITETIPVSAAVAMINFVPTVNRVSLPVPPLSAKVAASALPATVQPEPIAADSWVSSVAASPEDTPDDDHVIEQHNSVDTSSLIPSTTTAEEKLLNADADAEAGVSEFLPCADFMGPGVSPSPCFSLSDSPLGSQNSSPVTSPATFQASSNDEDGCPSSPSQLGTDGMPRRTKLLKHNRGQPAVTYTRFDHGNVGYRRSSDSEPSSTTVVIKQTKRQRSLSKVLGRKQVAAARTATPTSSVSSPTTSQSSNQALSPASVTPTCPSSQPTSPATTLLIVQQAPVSGESKNNDGPVNKMVIKRITRKRTASPTAAQADSQTVEEVDEPSLAKALKRDKSQTSFSSPAVKEINTETPPALAATPSVLSASNDPSPIEASIEAVITSVVIKEEKDDAQVVRPKHQGRGRPPKNRIITRPPEIESAAIVLPSNTEIEVEVAYSPERNLPRNKRRSSGRANKKPARLNDYMTGKGVNEPRKRTKSETSSTAGENNSLPEVTITAKKSATATVAASATSVRVASPVLTTVQASLPVFKMKGPKKYSSRGKHSKIGKR